MKILFRVVLTGICLMLFATGHSRAAMLPPNSTPLVHFSPRVLVSRDLGRCNGFRIRCKLLYTGDKDSGNYDAKFIARDRKGHLRVFLRNIGEGFAPSAGWEERLLEAQDYIGVGHKQIYVSTKVRMTHSLLLDCNGRGVRVLYEREDVFCSDLSRTKHGRWVIEELSREDCLESDGPAYEIVDEWRYEPHTREEAKEHLKEEREERGLKKRTHKQTMEWESDHGTLTALQVLHWNGKAFVPEKGAFKVFMVNNTKYCRQHDLPLPQMRPASN